MRIAFVGGGMMAEAMIRGLLGEGVAKTGDMVIGEISPERCVFLKEKCGISAVSDNVSAVKGADVVVLAVKPVSLGQVLKDLHGKIQKGQLVLSIVAGASIPRIADGLGYRVIVRAMPNMPAQVGEGVSVWTATAETSEDGKEMTHTILGSLGMEVFVGEEKYVDMATAVSGSGPAFVLLMIESLIDAGVHIGLPRELVEALVLQTVLGTASMAQKSERHPAELRNLVTSPGGTTAEGLLQLEQGGLRALFTEAVVAAYEKTKDLGGSV